VADLHTKLRVPYDRPTQLSDPSCDFEGFDLDGILACPDTEMGWDQFCCIFQSYLPAGTYEECAYFIPSALLYMAEADSEPTLIDNFLCWVSQRVPRLQEDGIYDGVMQSIHMIMLDALSRYDLHTNSDGYHYPAGVDHIDSIMDALDMHEEFGLLGDTWMQEWYGGKIDTYEKAAWVLYWVDHALHLSIVRSELMKAWSRDGELVQSCCNVVTDRVLSSTDSVLLDYWDRMLKRVDWIGVL
jgi:hypothetical protein